MCSPLRLDFYTGAAHLNPGLLTGGTSALPTELLLYSTLVLQFMQDTLQDGLKEFSVCFFSQKDRQKFCASALISFQKVSQKLCASTSLKTFLKCVNVFLQ